MAPSPIILPAVFGLFVVGLFVAIIVTAFIFSLARGGKAAGGAFLMLPLLLLGIVCLYMLSARSHPDTMPSREVASVVYDEAAADPPAPPAEAATIATSESVVTEIQSEASSAPAPNEAPPGQASPIRTQTAGAARPAWMDQPTGYRDGVYRTIATAGPNSTPQECNQELNDALNKAVHNYVGRFLSQRAGAEIELPPAFIHERIVRGEWLERSEYHVGPMYNLHALLAFDSSVNQEIDRRYRESQISGRLASTGVGAAIVLGLIATMFGYLKLDTLTRGYYTGRLRLAAATAILALATVAGLLARGNFGFHSAFTMQ